MSTNQHISPNVVILTKEEFAKEMDASFARGVVRGKLEAAIEQRKAAKTGEA